MGLPVLLRLCLHDWHCSNTDGHEEIPKEKNHRDLNLANAQDNGRSRLSNPALRKMLVQISTIYESCMAGDSVLLVKDLLQMPHPSNPRKYLLSQHIVVLLGI